MPKSLRSSRKNNSSSKKASNGKPISSATKAKLIEFLIKSAEQQRKLEIVKETLCEEEQFTPGSLFHRIDSSRKGFIVEKDVEEFLVDNKAKFKGSELKLLFGKLNRNQSSSGVNLREFQNAILPNQNPRLRYFTMRRPVYIPLPHEKLSEKIQWISLKLFSQIVKESTKLMEYNSALIGSFDFNAPKIFELLAGEGSDFITGESLNKFANENDVQMSMEEIGCLAKLVDRKGEGRLDSEDFNHYVATLGLKKQHEIFDELSPIPALKNSWKQEQALLAKDRDATLWERYLDNKSYNKEFENTNMGLSRKSLSKSRRNY